MAPAHVFLRIGFALTLLSGPVSDAGAAEAASPARVRVESVPEGGLQPDAVTDDSGRVHLIYLTGDPKAADIRYVTRSGPDSPWSPPRTVNSQPGAAIAVGTVRGPRLAMGQGNAIHVVWNGSGQARPKPAEGTALLCSRLLPGNPAFEPQRAVGGATRHLDGGSAVAADGRGTVLAVWHAALPTPPPGGDDETKRAVFVARSTDSGATFAEPRRIDRPGTGVCACCGLAAGFRADGTAFVIYRGAEGGSGRGLVQLSSTDGGRNFASGRLDRWELSQCPMTTARLVPAGASTLAVWSTRGTVHAARLEENGAAADISGPDHRANHPVAAVGPTGSVLVAWTEGTGWQRGGGFAWQTLDPALSPAGPASRRPGVPVWGALALWSERDGSFTLLH